MEYEIEDYYRVLTAAEYWKASEPPPTTTRTTIWRHNTLPTITIEIGVDRPEFSRAEFVQFREDVKTVAASGPRTFNFL